MDEVATWDAALAALGTHEPVELDVYSQVTPQSVGFEPAANFAIVHGVGAVVVGAGTYSGGTPVMASDSVSEALRDAAKDPAGEGDPAAHRQPGRLAARLGPDLAGDPRRPEAGQAGRRLALRLAASGGYYVASAADAIVSQPQTLTGSIGVFVIRPVLAGLMEKLGIGVESITRGARADLLLSTVPMSAETRAVLRDDVQHTYERFLDRVAEGRGMSAAAVNEVARGRVWTGEQALELGLVDRLGGIPEAVLAAKEKAGLAADADVLLVQYPPPKPLAQQFVEALQGGGVSLERLGWPARRGRAVRRPAGAAPRHPALDRPGLDRDPLNGRRPAA